VKVELSAGARAEAQRIDAWWRGNRPAARNQALLSLAGAPALGSRYTPKSNVRRLLLRRTHYYLYTIEQPERVYVVAVWSAFRGHGPRL